MPEDKDIQGTLSCLPGGGSCGPYVRDTCRLRPGIKGLSDNIRVISIVGRFLEHTRIYYFRNSGQEEYFIGSADIMKRNLEDRVEVVTPIEGQQLRAELRKILDIQLSDKRNAWEMQANGSYVQLQAKPGEEQRGCQEQFIALAKARLVEARKISKKLSKKKIAKRKRK